ncbi:MAG: hypothetical protein JKY45_09105 [Emcibacter sp.]|nr:hypothetical protein [Emcibacter sp.]
MARPSIPKNEKGEERKKESHRLNSGSDLSHESDATRSGAKGKKERSQPNR